VCVCVYCSLSFAEDSDMTVISIDSDTTSATHSHTHTPKWGPIAEESVVRALEILMHAPNYPVLITCKHGRALTGAVVGCLRKLQRWSLTSIFEEYRRYARTRLEQQHERFIE
jgi:tyrosine-protein phosphatase OCA1